MPFAKSAPDWGRTEVLLSFPMADKGVLFAQWLRDKLMAARRWTMPNAVYIDNIAMRRFDQGTTITMDLRQLGARRWFRTGDGETRMESKGVIFFGAANPDWNKHYVQAMREARSMILIGTEGWLNSRNCVKEYVQFGDENRRRAQAGEPPLVGLCLVFPPEQGGVPDAAVTMIQQHGWRILRVSRTAAHEFPYCRLGGWALSDSSLKEVLEALPA